MRVDVTKREVGSFYGGKRGSERSVACPVCSKPALYVKTSRKDGKTIKHYAHGFIVKLNSKHDPEIQWDATCEDKP